MSSVLKILQNYGELLTVVFVASLLLMSIWIYKKNQAVSHFLFFAFSIGIIHLTLGIDNPASLAVVGLIGSFQIAAYFHFLGKGRKKYQCVFLSKANTAFSKNIIAGFKSSIDGETFDVTYIQPTSTQIENPVWQLEELQKLRLKQVDFLVTVPVSAKPEYATVVCELIRKGTEVIFVDYKVPNAYFYSHGLLPPFFIYSNPIIGGNLIGEYMRTFYTSDKDEFICVVGSGRSAVALYRVEAALLKIATGESSKKISVIELDNWNHEEVIASLAERLNKSRSSGRKIVFCGNDVILDYLDRKINDNKNDRVYLFGFDGALGQDDELLIYRSRYGHATVKIDAFQHGQMAANLLASIEQSTKKTDLVRKHEIPPKLIKREYS